MLNIFDLLNGYQTGILEQLDFHSSSILYIIQMNTTGLKLVSVLTKAVIVSFCQKSIHMQFCMTVSKIISSQFMLCSSILRKESQKKCFIYFIVIHFKLLFPTLSYYIYRCGDRRVWVQVCLIINNIFKWKSFIFLNRSLYF